MHSLECGSLLIEGTKILLAHATDLYKNPFGLAPINLFRIDPTLCSTDETLSPRYNDDVTSPFSLEEIKAARFSMEPNRAPWPDNIPTEIYEHCWNIVCFNLFWLFEWFYEGKLDVQHLNNGIITLLPKSSDAKTNSVIQAYLPFKMSL